MGVRSGGFLFLSGYLLSFFSFLSSSLLFETEIAHNGASRITNGIWSDYAAMAVRTGPPGSGAAGISLMVVPLKNHPGVTMRRLSVSGQATGGTTYIELDDVRVPVENILGQENQGMRYIMTNFNHERLTVATGTTRQARVTLSAAFEYVLKREAFGKPLVEQPVVRHRLAKAGALLESLTAWVEQFAYMMTKLPHDKADALGGPTALLKAHAGMVFKECADTAVLLFGGNGFTKTGQGQLVESESWSFSSILHPLPVPQACGVLIAVSSALPRSHGHQNPRRFRGRPARPCRAAAGQDLQDADQGAGGAGRIQAVRAA